MGSEVESVEGRGPTSERTASATTVAEKKLPSDRSERMDRVWEKHLRGALVSLEEFIAKRGW